jgi:hypothetical protein
MFPNSKASLLLSRSEIELSVDAGFFDRDNPVFTKKAPKDKVKAPAPMSATEGLI